MTEPPPSDMGSRARLGPSFVLCLIVLVGLVALAAVPSIIRLLGINTIDGRWFLDSFAILAANDALRQGLNPWENNPLDILGRGHVYSAWWLSLGSLGLTRDHNFLFGAASVGLFLIVAVIGLKPRTLGEAAWVAALMLSPPFLLAVNRANNDLLIFALVGGGLLLVRSAGEWARWSCYGVAVAVATGLKFYPILAVGALGLLVRPIRRMWLVVGGAGLLSLVILLSVADRLPYGMLKLPESIYTYGAPVLLRRLGLSGGMNTFWTALGVLGAVGGALAAQGVTGGLTDERSGSVRIRAMFATGALLLTGCFVAGESYAYRWLFALWLWPWLWRQAKGDRADKAAITALVMLGISLWGEGVFCLIVNLHGGFTESEADRLSEIWTWGMHLIHWSLMGLLTGWLGEAAMSTLREARQRPSGSTT